MLIVEIARKTLTRVAPNGAVSVVATLGGGPNGVALGPDGAAYVCNNGGLSFRDTGAQLFVSGLPEDVAGGSIQRVDLRSGAATTLYTRVDGRPLNGPNDLVFDGWGGFWFTDTGKIRPRSRDQGGLYWARADGSEIREVVYPLLAPNGVTFAPDGRTLYVAVGDRRILAYTVEGPGVLARQGGGVRVWTVAAPAGDIGFDNLVCEAGGNLVVAAVRTGGLLVMSPTTGAVLETVALPDPITTAMAFGGPGDRTLYVTLSSTGKVIALDWPRPGLPRRPLAPS
ncbi:SMP-30/gluconolactonase/LRE family protein [soil metagenome]